MKRISLKEIQNLELEMLIELDKFCTKNKIKYFIGCGTLAGAVLEKGFFDWDDDVDVLMPRDDYEKFISLYNSKKYKLLTCNQKDYYYPYAKLVNTNTIAFECKNNIKDYGVFIDVFPIDGSLNNFYLNRIKPLKFLMMSQWGCYLDNRNIVVKIIYNICSLFTHFFPKNFFARRVDKICKKHKISDCKRAGIVCHHKYKREIMDKEIFDDTTTVIFEGYKFNAPKKYEEYLNNLYVDYKKDDSNNSGHNHFKAYWK